MHTMYLGLEGFNMRIHTVLKVCIRHNVDFKSIQFQVESIQFMLFIEGQIVSCSTVIPTAHSIVLISVCVVMIRV